MFCMRSSCSHTGISYLDRSDAGRHYRALGKRQTFAFADCGTRVLLAKERSVQFSVAILSYTSHSAPKCAQKAKIIAHEPDKLGGCLLKDMWRGKRKYQL